MNVNIFKSLTSKIKFQQNCNELNAYQMPQCRSAEQLIFFFSWPNFHWLNTHNKYTVEEIVTMKHVLLFV